MLNGGSVRFFFVVIIIVLFGAFKCFAQKHEVSGNVKDTLGRNIPNVNVSLRDSKQAIIAYGYTNEQGNYQFAIRDSTFNTPKLYIQATLLGYGKTTTPLIFNLLNYNFVLKETLFQLDEINIKNRPTITKSGDTLSYTVNSFSRPEDRSIGDVIKRLPGVTVDEDGRISFNGQAITNLFIGGDDLMAGRYGLATKAINKDIISKIEVLKNHQPIKVLKDKILTNDIAMNLVLKNPKSFTTSADGMIGGGAPAQYDAYLNLITLNNDIKMLNSAKVNNSGVDYNSDFKQLATGGNLASNSFNRPSFIVNSSTISNPDLPKQTYYFNNSEVINLNNLINTKNKMQYRLNIQGFFDKNNMVHLSKLENYLPNDTIVYNETQQLAQKTNLLNFGFSANKNTSKIFINNQIGVNLKRDEFFSPLNFNSLEFNQTLKNSIYDFSNAFNYIPLLKKDAVLSFNFNINYFSNPQNLFIDKGINPEIINNGNAYQGLIQNIRIPAFFLNASSAYIIPNKLIKQSYQVGASTEVKYLNSNISLINSAANNNIDGNELNWSDNKIYFHPKYGLKTNHWEINLTTPVQFQKINYNDNTYALDENFTQLNINPKLNVNLKTGEENYVYSDLSFNNNIGDINTVYRGDILLNYRTIQNNDAEIQVKKSITFGLKYHLEKSIKLAFSNVSLGYSRISANAIAFTVVSKNAQQTVFIPLKNLTSTLNFGADISKYVYFLKAKVYGSALVTKLRTNLFLNNELLPYTNKNVTANFGVDTKVLDELSVNYNLAYRYGKSEQNTNALTTFNFINHRLDQFLSINYNIKGRFFVEGFGQYVFNNQQNVNKSSFFFLNTSLKYRFLKPSLEINTDFSNLLNTKRYIITSLTSNQLSESIYNIRGTMAIMRLKYIF